MGATITPPSPLAVNLNTPANLPDSLAIQQDITAPYTFPGGFTSQINVGTHFILSIYPGHLQPLQCTHNGIFTYMLPQADKKKVIHRRCNPALLSSRASQASFQSLAQEVYEKEMGSTAAWRDMVTDAPAGTIGYSVLQVFDTFIFQMDWDKRELKPQLFPAGSVATGLVNDWLRGMMAINFGFQPGVVAVDHATLTNPKALSQLVEGLRKNQEAMFMAWVKEATDLAGKHKFEDINERHHLAANWLGIMDREVHPWLRPLSERAKKDCPACGEQIDGLAKRCKHCQQDLIDWYTKYPSFRTQDPVVDEFLTKLGTALLPKPTPATAKKE